MGTHRLVSELSLDKPLHPVRVKVICKGPTVVGSGFQKTVLIIGDEKGNTIQATLVRDLEASADMPLEEGHSYEIKDFELSHVIPERVRLTRNRYNINITKSSVVLKIDPIKHFSFYCFPNWDDLYRGLHHPKFPIDIYGQVIGVGFLEEYIMEPVNGNNGIIDHKIRFFVLHIPNVVIKCVAYGALAHVFNDLWNSIDADIVLCVLQCWQINWGQGNLL
ncbi:BnaA07g28570D [Brassica napus]|uniref:(rape) hypothetical protein n=1 Tax=Brassica napus TaxID=3708 RepID=A0A078HJU5_BRANA|nr:unnamed protein product [Brassica napus]CDY38785.1 BnaA07g28570D [Brassica napus]